MGHSLSTLSYGHDLAKDEEKDVGESREGIVKVDLLSWGLGRIWRVDHLLGEWSGTELSKQCDTGAEETNKDQDMRCAVNSCLVLFNT